MTEDAPTFVCKDCGVAVFDALGEKRERCYPCQWVAAIPDLAERAAVRAWLESVGAIDAPQAVSAIIPNLT
jgi:hypothetical protein